MTKFILIALSAILSISLAQKAGQYRPFPSVSIVGQNSGRYNPNNDGRYRPENTGRYSGDNDGRYRPDNSGRYSGSDGKYQPDESGRYNPDGSGAYSGQNAGYKHDGSNDKYKYQGDKYGSGGTGASKAGPGSGISAAGEFGAPIALKTGSAAGKYDNRNYAIIRLEGNVEEDGYHYLYETENGILGEEQGKLANKDTDEEAMRASGFFTYTGQDNVEYTVRYTADENGFVPEAAHLPTPPPIPEAIARALEYQRQQGTL